ncbi:MAG: serine/threonine-protein kinase [Enterobacterales bacterium]|nr:serine/threonine-protein kinase [Enterobacterales bacterium]
MTQSSTHSLSSLFKSGWVYLWCFLILGILSLDQQGFWQPLDKLNQKLWTSEPLFSNSQPNALYRVIDIRFDQAGAKQINKLITLFPQATFALSGDYSTSFFKMLQHQDYQQILQRSIFLTTQSKSQVTPINTRWNQPWAQPLSLAIPHKTDVLWQVNQMPRFGLQPEFDAVNNTQQSLVWRKDEQFYPSFLTLLLEAYFAPKIVNKTSTSSITLELGIQNQLLIQQRVFLIGVHAEIIALDPPANALSYQNLLQIAKQDPQAAQKKLILWIDDLSIPAAKPLAQSLNSLINSHYLTSNWLSKSVEYLLLFLVFLSFVAMDRFSFKLNSFLVLASVGFLLLLQSFFMSHLDWVSIRLPLIVSLMTLIIRLAYLNEKKQLLEQNKKTNQLLSDSATLFFQSQKLEQLFSHLNAAQPDTQLINRIFQTALEAEAQQNIKVAKQLHQWILKQDPQFRPSIDRMLALFPHETKSLSGNSNDTGDTLEIDNFDQTLAVSPSVQGQGLPNTSLVNIKHFGRYQVEGILGRGAMGVVFQGVDPKINRQVAIKTLMINQQLDGESLEVAKKRFFREAETAGKLSHAHIVTIYDVGEQHHADSDQTLGYIAMDLLTGAPLSEYTKEDKLLPTALVYQLMIQMTDALDYAHKQKVIHRDIKPANILFDDDLQRGTLTDFGIAYIADHSKTKTGTIMGSPYYMSPEQIIGIKVDGRSDIFSLGVTFYQLLSGQLPFTGESIATVAFQITKSKHQSVRQWNKKLPSSAARITNKAMHKDKHKRYQSMREFKEALVKALARDFKKVPLQ